MKSATLEYVKNGKLTTNMWMVIFSLRKDTTELLHCRWRIYIFNTDNSIPFPDTLFDQLKTLVFTVMKKIMDIVKVRLSWKMM